MQWLAKGKPQRTKRDKSKTAMSPARAASMISMAAQNLINMVAVGTTSGAVLLSPLAAKHF
jgi:hypothetical protein